MSQVFWPSITASKADTFWAYAQQNQTIQTYQVGLVSETIVPQPHDCCSTWLNVIYLFLTWQGSYTVKLTDEKDTMIRGGIVLFGIKLCNQ